MKRFFTLLIILCLAGQSFSANQITGQVKNLSGSPIQDATVFAEWVKGNEVKRKFANTLKDGTFFLVVDTLPIKLSVSKDQYLSYEQTITKAQFLEIVLSDRVNVIKPLVLSGVRKNANETSQVVVNSREIAQQNSAVDLPSLLRFQPSVTITTDAGNGVGYSGIRIRGTDATRINVTLNGIPVNDPESQGVFWVNTPDLASGLNNIQITRGVGSSTNGSGSFGGTVSLQTEDPANAVSRVEMAYGSFNTLRTTVSANTGNINGFAAGIKLSNIQSDGYMDRASSNLQSYQVNLAYRAKNTSVRFLHMNGREKTYQAWYGLDRSLLETNRTFNVAGIYTDANGQTQFYENQTDNYGQKYYQLFVDQNFLNEQDLRINGSVGLFYTQGGGYYEEYQEDATLASYGLGTDTTDLIRQLHLLNDYMGAVYSLEVQSKKWKFLLGGGLNQYTNNHFGLVVNSTQGINIKNRGRYYDSDATKSEINNYLKVNYQSRIQAWRANFFADLQLRLINYNAQGIHDDLSTINFDQNFTFFNPKIGFNATKRKAQISHRWDVFAGVGQREPTRNDFLNSASTPEPEQMVNLEVGKSLSAKNWAIMANGYLMYYQNQLVLTGQLDAVGTPLRENVGESYRAGIEIAGEYTLRRDLKIGGNLTLSDNRVLDYTEELAGDTIISRGNSPIAYSPNWISTFFVRYKYKKVEIMVQNKTVGKQYLDNTGVEDKSIPMFNTTDLIINYPINLRGITRRNTPINLSFYVYNLTNTDFVNNGWAFSFRDAEEYISVVGVYPQAPIHFMVKAAYLF